MNTCVVDASVAIKWYVPETHHENALRFLRLLSKHSFNLHVPDLFFSEFGNILWKKTRRSQLDEQTAGRIARDLLGWVFTSLR